MDEVLLQRVAAFAPPWLRYVLTAGEIGRVGCAWVIGSGDDIALVEVGDGHVVMPVWPYESLAEGASTGATFATTIGARELIDQVLPWATENGLEILVFPGHDNVAVSPEGFGSDITLFAQEGRQVAEGLAREPVSAVMDGPVVLETPEIATDGDESDASDVAARFWVLMAEDSLAVAGTRFGEFPALALFDSRQTAETFADTLGEDAPPMAPRPLSVEDLASRWLLLAFSGGWDVAIVTGGSDVGRVDPVRLALDLSEEAMRA